MTIVLGLLEYFLCLDLYTQTMMLLADLPSTYNFQVCKRPAGLEFSASLKVDKNKIGDLALPSRLQAQHFPNRREVCG